MDKTNIHRNLYRSDREVALGGNVLIHAGESGTVEDQERNVEAICGYLMTLVECD